MKEKRGLPKKLVVFSAYFLLTLAIGINEARGGSPTLSTRTVLTAECQTLQKIDQSIINLKKAHFAVLDAIEILNLEGSITNQGARISKMQGTLQLTLQQIDLAGSGMINLQATSDIRAQCKRLSREVQEKVSIYPDKAQTAYGATCIFKSKTKVGVEIGRRELQSNTKQELDALIRQHCVTNDFDVSVKYKGSNKTKHTATCIFMSKTKKDTEIGRRSINASSKQELGAMIRQQCTTNDFHVKVQYD